MSLDAATLRPPIRISLDADIPSGSAINVVVKSASASTTCRFVAPTQTFRVLTEALELGFEFDMPRGSLATPFLRAVKLESDRLLAVSAEGFEVDENEYGLASPPGEPSYLFRKVMGGQEVGPSDVGRPWKFSIVGDAPGGSTLYVMAQGKRPDGGDWSVRLSHDAATLIDPTSFSTLSYGVRLGASANGHYTPTLEGIVIEGDGRRLFVPVDQILDGNLPDAFQLIKHQTGSVLMLAPILPEFLGPPSVLERIRRLYDEGKLNPEALE